MTTSVPPTEPEPQLTSVASAAEPAAKKGLRISPKFVLTVVILAAVIWFALANRKNAQIKLWVHTVQAPVWLVLLGTFVAGIIIGLLLRRRRKPRV